MAHNHSSANMITVGSADADIPGADGRSIQIAVDALASRGGGTVQLMPGEYVLEDSIRLCDNLTLSGDPEGTVLKRGEKVWSPLAVDADIGQKQITPADASGFRAGMGVCLRDDAKPTAMSNGPLTVTAVSDGVLYVHDYVTRDWNAERGGLVVNYFPLVFAREAENVTVECLTIDQAVKDREGIELLRSSGLYMERCRDVRIRNVVARNVEGDGICIATCEDVTIEDCRAYDNIEYGVHPGSHSPRCKVLRCEMYGNGADGLYICWGVRESLFAENDIHHNGHIKGRSGISIGHKDTDNLFERNHIHDNVRHGIHFRQKTEANGAHRNTFRDNVIENNGSADSPACGVNVQGITHDLMFERNVIRDTRDVEARGQKHALRLAEGVSRVKAVDNTITGHTADAILDESASRDHQLQQA